MGKEKRCVVWHLSCYLFGKWVGFGIRWKCSYQLGWAGERRGEKVLVLIGWWQWYRRRRRRRWFWTSAVLLSDNPQQAELGRMARVHPVCHQHVLPLLLLLLLLFVLPSITLVEGQQTVTEEEEEETTTLLPEQQEVAFGFIHSKEFRVRATKTSSHIKLGTLDFVLCTISTQHPIPPSVWQVCGWASDVHALTTCPFYCQYYWSQTSSSLHLRWQP